MRPQSAITTHFAASSLSAPREYACITELRRQSDMQLSANAGQIVFQIFNSPTKRRKVEYDVSDAVGSFNGKVLAEVFVLFVTGERETKGIGRGQANTANWGPEPSG